MRHRYNHTEIVFISHTIDAKEVSEDDFFKKGSSGGTFVSAGIEKCIEITQKRYHRSSWNIYTFHCSDGDNWPEDNDRALTLSKQLKEICQLYCFIQISSDAEDSTFWSNGGMVKTYSPIADSKFKLVHIPNKDKIWPEFSRIFGGKV